MPTKPIITIKTYKMGECDLKRSENVELELIRDSLRIISYF